jgi:hypothetical protein
LPACQVEGTWWAPVVGFAKRTGPLPVGGGFQGAGPESTGGCRKPGLSDGHDRL